MKWIALIISSALLTACATTPQFQKKSSDFGYSTTDLSSKTHFRVTVDLPEETSRETKSGYAFRAIGEECASRGYQHFDYSTESESTFIGFCYATPEKKALGVVFATVDENSTDKKFVVESFSNKPSTQLKVGDQVTDIANQKLTSLGQLKSIVATADPKANSLKIKIVRDGKTSEVTEPLVLLKGALAGPAELENIRKKVR